MITFVITEEGIPWSKDTRGALVEGHAGPDPSTEAWNNPVIRVAALLFVLATALSADSLADVRARGELVWGADQAGGGPYVYPRDDDPTRVTGFEVDLADAIAERLGVRATFAQGEWSTMPELLRTGKVDVVLNGYEWTPARAMAMEASIPYFVYGLQLLARKDDTTLTSWEDLERPVQGRKRKVGVLTESAAEKHLAEHCADTVEIIGYDGNTDSMREVETGKLDATLQDTPIASFYGSRFPGLTKVGVPVGRGYYVIFARKGETALVSALNEAIIGLARDGSLRRIYQRYGIWDPAQRELATLYGFVEVPYSAEEGKKIAERPRGVEVVRRYGWILLQSAGMTVILSVLSFPAAVLIGLLIAIGRLYGPRLLRYPLAWYVEFLRGTPVMLQLYFVFFFLPEIGIQVPAFWTAILGLAINYSAYESEIYRAGLQAIPPGQMEAALSLGMSRGLALRRIVIPQAFRIVIPPVMNDFIALFKDTSVCSVVTIIELTKRFSVLSQSTQATIELMGMTALLYLFMSYPLSILSRKLELRMLREQQA